jgi:far upstream element-binding protein
MAEEEVIAIPVQPSDHKRKLENLESEILEQQHAGSIDNDVSVDDDKNASDYCQPKRPKLDDEAVDGLGIGGTVENSGDVESKEEGTEKPIAQSDENQDGNPLIEKVQETIDAEESDNKMEDNGKPEDNQLVTPEVVTSQDVSVEESKEVNISGSQNEGEDDSKETNDVVAQKEVENGSKEVTDCDSQKEDEANAGGESKEVNGSVSHDEIGDESKEVNGGSTHKEVDDTQSTTRRIDVPSSKVGTLIGKGGEMVRYLQVNSGAKIQIRRDAEADPSSALRPVEIIGTVSCIEKAEKLINAVIAEVEAGGVPALAARGVPEQMEIKVPSDKVGVIIGRGGETIKNMQTKSRARIQGKYE